MPGDTNHAIGVPARVRARAMLVDDHPLYRLGLRMVLTREGQLECVAEAGTAQEALAIASEISLDIALVDLILPVMDGVALTQRLRAVQPSCAVLGMSVVEDPLRISELLRAGAAGYVLKSQPVEELTEAITSVLGGVRYLPPSIAPEDVEAIKRPIDQLTRREREILGYLVRGCSNDDISTSLFISRRTVETHRQRILRKLDAHTIAQMFAVAARHGVVDE